MISHYFISHTLGFGLIHSKSYRQSNFGYLTTKKNHFTSDKVAEMFNRNTHHFSLILSAMFNSLDTVTRKHNAIVAIAFKLEIASFRT